MEEKYFIFLTVLNLEECKLEAPYSCPATMWNVRTKTQDREARGQGHGNALSEPLKLALPVVNSSIMEAQEIPL